MASKRSGVSFSVVTLNCWALPFIWPLGSKDRKYRLLQLTKTINEDHYDVVTLQEIWSESDFEFLVSKLNENYPYTHYFHSGFTGSGVCVFSRHKIVSTLMHRYSLNGFAHHIHRGDWFGGKLVGMAEIIIEGYRISVLTTHLHAEYNRKNDLYLPHRVSQALELSQFVKHISRGSDATILTGDLNLEPCDLGYYLILENGGLTDAWAAKPESTAVGAGMTSGRPDNCYTSRSALKELPNGQRIDYIMFRSGKAHLKVDSCSTRFNHIACDKSEINYSDHVGVYVEFTIDDEPINDRRKSCVSSQNILRESMEVVQEGEKRALWDHRLFLGLCVVALLLLLSTINFDIYLPDYGFLIIPCRFILTLFIAFCSWYGILGLRMEMKALKAAKYSLSVLNDVY